MNPGWRKQAFDMLKAQNVRLFIILGGLTSVTPGGDENSRGFRCVESVAARPQVRRYKHHTSSSCGQGGIAAGHVGIREDNFNTCCSPCEAPTRLLRRKTDAERCRSLRESPRTDAYAKLTEQTEFRLQQDGDGQCLRTWGSVKRLTRVEVLKALDEGKLNQAEMSGGSWS